MQVNINVNEVLGCDSIQIEEALIQQSIDEDTKEDSVILELNPSSNSPPIKYYCISSVQPAHFQG